MLPTTQSRPSFSEAAKVWLKIGLLSFGGPAGQIALMHRMLVDERRWITEDRFLHALNYCMLLPGPEAQQLAIYVGWLMHKILGGLVAGILFVLPGAAVMLALSILYAGFQDVSLVQGTFFGIKAAVLAVVIEAVIRIGKRALKNQLMVAIAAAAFIAILFFTVPFPLIVIGAGLIGIWGGQIWPHLFAAAGGGHGPAKSSNNPSFVAAVDEIPNLGHTQPSIARLMKLALVFLILWFAPIAILAAAFGLGNVFTQQSLFFSKMAIVTFGGAYAVLAYVAQQAVETYGWLGPGEMLDGLGMAETTPGPLIMVVQFVGFLGAYRNPGSLDPMIAGACGAAITVWVTFVPCFLWIFLGAPYIESLRGNRRLTAALSAITAAVVGVVLNLAVWFGLHVAFGEVAEVWIANMRFLLPVWSTVNIVSVALTVAALIAMLRFKIGMIPVLGMSAVLGITYIMVARGGMASY